jgi:hypothetical protein
VASVGINQNLITDTVFSAIVGVVIITTLITPPLLRIQFPHTPAGAPAVQETQERNKA